MLLKEQGEALANSCRCRTYCLLARYSLVGHHQLRHPCHNNRYAHNLVSHFVFSSSLTASLTESKQSFLEVILVFSFDVSAITTTDRGMIGGFIVLLFLFGPAAAAFSYCVSFMFKNPSLCNITLIVSGFLISMGASMSKC